MAEFRYEAIDRTGLAKTGQISAGTIRQAIDELTAKGLHVRRVVPNRDDEPLEVTEFLPALSEPAAANVAGLLAEAVRGELPLEPALRAAAEDAPRSERRVLIRIADDLARGIPSDEAFLRAGDALPSHLLALILAGLESNDLARLLSRYLTLVRQRADARRPLLLNLLYPMILIVGTMKLLLAVFIYIVPEFRKIFDDFGTELPFLTTAVMAVSDFLLSFWWPMALAVGFVGLMVWLYLYVLRRRGYSLWSLPGLDLFVRPADWGRFCGLLALLIESRQPLPMALRLAAAAALTMRVRSTGLLIADDVEAGMTPWEAALPRTFPAPVRQVFRWANRPDVFVEALEGLSELYFRRARMSASFIGFFIEPFVLTFLAATMGLVIVALILPLFKLLNDLA